MPSIFLPLYDAIATPTNASPAKDVSLPRPLADILRDTASLSALFARQADASRRCD
ncbi:MAG: hypothetical protein U1C55_07410 [Smithellaceae bacterium]|nr:hypothetical protein [Smithellaceae bacterium]